MRARVQAPVSILEVLRSARHWLLPQTLFLGLPAATLYSAIVRELKTKGANARFRKTERGKFGALVKTVQR